MSEEKVGRRDYVKYLGSLIGGLVIGVVLGYLAKPAEIITETVERTITEEVPVTETVERVKEVPVEVTKTVERTVTKILTKTLTVTPTPTPTPTEKGAWGKITEFSGSVQRDTTGFDVPDQWRMVIKASVLQEDIDDCELTIFLYSLPEGQHVDVITFENWGQTVLEEIWVPRGGLGTPFDRVGAGRFALKIYPRRNIVNYTITVEACS